MSGPGYSGPAVTARACGRTALLRQLRSQRERRSAWPVRNTVPSVRHPHWAIRRQQRQLRATPARVLRHVDLREQRFIPGQGTATARSRLSTRARRVGALTMDPQGCRRAGVRLYASKVPWCEKTQGSRLGPLRFAAQARGLGRVGLALAAIRVGPALQRRFPCRIGRAEAGASRRTLDVGGQNHCVALRIPNRACGPLMPLRISGKTGTHVGARVRQAGCRPSSRAACRPGRRGVAQRPKLDPTARSHRPPIRSVPPGPRSRQVSEQGVRGGLSRGRVQGVPVCPPVRGGCSPDVPTVAEPASWRAATIAQAQRQAAARSSMRRVVGLSPSGRRWRGLASRRGDSQPVGWRLTVVSELARSLG
ncbi:hypothetical protein HEP81_08117 (plasmid) [Streptomyces griseofuscus]|uniref:Uncharacterized protein n=1 Tax=Streptomyces griseofuscus TaxID=146922 RepID=A0A7H1QDG5_9ACTN|nr:hypothetical protein HEP81_08117 [Streptomyces griseofuscus]